MKLVNQMFFTCVQTCPILHMVRIFGLVYDYKDIGQFMDRFHCSDESKEHENE